MRISDWSSDVCSSDLPYTWRNSDVLRNKLGIRDDNILEEREAFFSVVRHGELVVQRAAPATNAREYRELHNHLFQDVYDWAGRSEERRAGKECVSSSRYWCSPYHSQQKAVSITLRI